MSEQFSLVNRSFPNTLSSGLYNLLACEQLVDVTLGCCEGQILRAHKLILSVCSSYFRELFKGNNCKHPIVILKDVNYRDLSAMLHFMYQGEVNIKQEDIPSFLKVAEVLQIKGLTKNFDEENVEKDEEASLQNQLYSLQKEAESQNDSYEKSNQSHCQTTIKKEILPQPTDPLCIQENQSENSSMTQDKRNYFQEESRAMEEPLNFTSQNNNAHLAKSSCTLDYKSTMDDDAGNKISMFNDRCLEQPTNSQEQETPQFPMMQYNQQYQEPSETPPEGEFSRQPSKGKKTVKGTPSSSLSLETTLRVISELGPTLRMERGKVIRMYSCPWCLRHFTRKENLKLHVRYIHGPMESLICKLCGNKYKNSNSLRVHSYLYHNTKRNKHEKLPIVSKDV